MAGESQVAGVCLSQRGRSELGSTALNVLQRYAQTLHDGQGQLILADVSDPVRQQLERTGTLTAVGAEFVLPADPRMVGSINAAWTTGQSLASRPRSGSSGAGVGGPSHEAEQGSPPPFAEGRRQERPRTAARRSCDPSVRFGAPSGDSRF